MTASPFFSIVIPVYNRSNIIQDTLESIVRQTLKDFEVHIIDDGSTDDSVEKIKSFVDSDIRFNLHVQHNQERGAARNNGYRVSKGKYVVFFDSDDLMHDDHLFTLHKFIISENPDFIATKFDFKDDSGLHHPSDMKDLRQGFYDYKLFLSGNVLACNICLKKGLPGLKLFEVRREYSIKEDWLFLMENLYHHKIFIIDKVTLTMRDHKNRSMRSDNSLIISRTKLAQNWIKERVNLSNEELKKLDAHVNYFCAIHSYIDHKKNDAVRYALNAIFSGGLKIKYLVMLTKSLIGQKLISRIR
jgi:GalNAc5-diNAcBac-PP-undecaprenol beta-1,3-glucosyltransferase